MIENTNINKSNHLLFKQNLQYQLQKNVIQQINKKHVPIVVSFFSNNNIEINLINHKFYDRTYYFGIINPEIQNDTTIYSLATGDGDTDNDKFYIKKNIVYSKRINDLFQQRNFYIRIGAKDIYGNTGYANYIIESYRTSEPFPSNIITCISNNTLEINFEKLNSQFNIDISTIAIYGQLKKIKKNVFEYISPIQAINDIIVFNVISDFSKIDLAIMIENFDQNRISNLPKSIGNFKFSNISVIKKDNILVWIFGSISTQYFVLFDEYYIIGNLIIYL